MGDRHNIPAAYRPLSVESLLNPMNEAEARRRRFFIGAGAAAVAMGAFVYFRFKTSLANEYLVRTGLGVADMQVSCND